MRDAMTAHYPYIKKYKGSKRCAFFDDDFGYAFATFLIEDKTCHLVEFLTGKIVVGWQ